MFDCAGSWNFGNDFAKIVEILDIKNNSPSHSDNCKNNFGVLVEGPTYDINVTFGLAGQKFSVIFTKEETQFSLNLHYNADNNYLSVNEKEIESQ